METKIKKIIYASEAIAETIKAQSENFEKAVERIEQHSKMGFNEVLLFGIGIGNDEVRKLMDLGYSVATVLHPFEQIKMFKVSW